MKKRILAALFAATLTLTAFAGCNTASSDSTSENSASASTAKESGTEAAKATLEKTSFNLGHLNSTAHLLGFVAKEEGYFEEEGLDVTLTLFSSAAELSSGLESEKLDVAFIGSVPALTFQSKGHDLTIFGGEMTRNVASVKNSVQDAELQILLKDKNIEIGEGEDKVNIVYFDSQKDAYNALQNDTIDAASAYSPYTSLAESQGYKIVYRCSEEELLKNQPCCRQVATTEALSKYPNSYNAFERALIKAYKFTQENKEQTVKDVKKYIDIEENLINTEVYGGYGTSVPDPDKQGTVALKNSIVELGYTEDYDIDKLYNTEIYKNALASLIKENPGDKIYAELQEHFDKYE